MKRLLIVAVAVVLTCFLAVGTAEAQISGYVDVANDGHGNTTIAYPSGTLTVQGWAADSGQTAPVQQVQVLIDNVAVGNATLGVSRPDVAAAFSNMAWLKSGWTFSYAVTKIAAGTHTVSAVASDQSGTFIGTLGPSSGACCSITITAPDLIESSVSVTGTPVSGGSIKINDTTSNVGSASAGASWTRMYLNSTNVKGGTLLGTRSISSLAANGAISTATTTVTLPMNITGAYYVVACANDTGSVVESNSANDCSGVQMTVGGADLTVTTDAFPAVAAVGATIQATDATANIGQGSASTSWTRFYLSKTTAKSGALVGTRSVAGLTPGGTSVGTTNVTVPTNTTAGAYYLVACANDTNSVTETNYANNCIASPLNVLSASSAIVVDAVNGKDTPNFTCSTAAPCKTIGWGLQIAAALGQQLVLAKPGTYTEQVTITQNVTLTSTTPYGAVIQAPPTLTVTTDPTGGGNNYAAIVSVGAANVNISNMTVQGPGPSGCGSLHYGIFVTSGSATVTGNQLLHIRDNPYSGCQNGVAVRFGSKYYGYVASGTITNNVIADYQKGGIVVDGPTTNVIVSGNTVTGQNVAGVNGQNGIQISRGATSAVTGNTVSKNLYGSSVCTVSADGILLYDETGGVLVTSNKVTANDEGIGVYSDSSAMSNAYITSNQVFANVYLGIHIDPNSGGNVIEFNAIYANGAGVGGYDETDETGSWTSPNNWGTDPSNYNILGNGGAYTQWLGPLPCS